MLTENVAPMVVVVVVEKALRRCEGCELSLKVSVPMMNFGKKRWSKKVMRALVWS